ncbi:MAG: nitroreductase family protein [Erysipelotrichales bacterium]
MDLYKNIFIRKSIRKYDGTKFSEERLNEIKDVVNNFEKLYDDVVLEYRIVEQTKGRFTIDAPHHLIISGHGDSRDQEAAGFLFEQLVLWFDANGIGSVWQGNAKDDTKNKDKNKDDIITIAFGKAQEANINRDLNSFKRKEINEITNISNDIMEAVRLSPSGLNLQPWYFEEDENYINVYEKKLGLPFGAIYKLTKVDLGIALAHYMIACSHFNKTFDFIKDDTIKNKKGYKPFGKIKKN